MYCVYIAILKAHAKVRFRHYSNCENNVSEQELWQFLENLWWEKLTRISMIEFQTNSSAFSSQNCLCSVLVK